MGRKNEVVSCGKGKTQKLKVEEAVAKKTFYVK